MSRNREDEIVLANKGQEAVEVGRTRTIIETECKETKRREKYKR